MITPTTGRATYDTRRWVAAMQGRRAHQRRSCAQLASHRLGQSTVALSSSRHGTKRSSTDSQQCVDTGHGVMYNLIGLGAEEFYEKVIRQGVIGQQARILNGDNLWKCKLAFVRQCI